MSLCGCEDCPNCPEIVENSSDYDIYFIGYTSQYETEYMWIYNTKDQKIIDSLLFEDLNSLEDMALSADGTKLVLVTEHDDLAASNNNVTVYSIPTLDTMVTYPVIASEVEISNTGKYVALFGRDSLVFLDGNTFQILFTDTVQVRGGRFLLDDSKFYAIKDYRYIRVYDMSSQALDTSIEYHDNDGNAPILEIVQPTADGSKLYLASAYGSTAGFVLAYILSLDSTTLSYPYTAGASDLRLTHDGRQMVFTDPGQLAIGVYGSAHVIFFNPETDAIISIVPAGQSISGGEYPRGFYPGEIAITPDSRYTFTGGCGNPVFGVIDNNLHEYIDVEDHRETWKRVLNVSCSKIEN
jgi:DNA-binding beta-propeller fold protein YncE